MIDRPDHVYDRSTKTLCEDSLHLCFEAVHAQHEMASRALARASFSATTMFLEAAANAILEVLDISNQLLDKIDKFPVVQKFEFFAQMKLGKKIDYSLHIVQGLSELFSVRNKYVHPKAQALEWKEIDSNTLVGVSKESPTLKLPYVSTYFKAVHAIKSLRVCHAFCNYFLVDLCEMTPQESTAMIFSLLKEPKSGGSALGPFLYAHMSSWMAHENIYLAHFEHSFHIKKTN